ncbi:predicted protein [Streptomyces iranensis]|uniref:Uncharacterized protein n=1 Tax=Streptomyces iranensis TaxID=576784 RepID=A0A060ZY19_9ACTN|nr:predicted protein [Streptomyces iranensis]
MAAWRPGDGLAPTDRAAPTPPRDLFDRSDE